MIEKPRKNEYDRLFRFVLTAMVIALAVLLVSVAVLLISGALSDGGSDGGIKIVTGDGTNPSGGTSVTDTDAATDEETAADNTGLVFPGGSTTEPPATSAVTEPVTEAQTEPVTEAQTEPPSTEPIVIVDDKSSVPRYTGLGGIENEFPGTVLAKTSDMGEDYLGNIVFLGDSLTYGLVVYGMLDGGRNTTQVWVPKNRTLLLNDVADAKIEYPETGAEISVRQAVHAKQPKILVISLGINGISYLDEDGFISQFTTLVSEVKKESPETVIILQSIFPVAASYKLQGSINNNKICRGNYWMAKAANQSGVYFLNTAEAVVGADGYLSEEMQSGDGLHIGTAAYKIVIDYIKTHGVTTD